MTREIDRVASLDGREFWCGYTFPALIITLKGSRYARVYCKGRYTMAGALIYCGIDWAASAVYVMDAPFEATAASVTARYRALLLSDAAPVVVAP